MLSPECCGNIVYLYVNIQNRVGIITQRIAEKGWLKTVSIRAGLHFLSENSSLEAEDLDTAGSDVLMIKGDGKRGSVVSCGLSLSKPIEWINTAQISTEYFHPNVLWEIPHCPLDFPRDAQSGPITHRGLFYSEGSGSRPGDVLSAGGCLAVSGDISDCYSWGGCCWHRVSRSQGCC